MTNLKKNLVAGIAAGALAVSGSVAIATSASAHLGGAVNETVTLTDEQLTTLTAMVAEEKLALDVYTALGDVHTTVTMFDQIAASEARHLEALRRVLTANSLTDPTAGDAAGVFDDATVQQLYTDLVEDGSVSVAAAATVGKTIETLDIADLEAALAATQPDVLVRVYTNLKAGSTKHLAAFTALEADPTATLPAGGQHDGTEMGNGHKGKGQAGKAGKGKTGKGKGKGKMGAKAGKGKGAGNKGARW